VIEMKKFLVLLAGVALGALLYQWLVHDKESGAVDKGAGAP
jgi:hypothetical protein